MLPQYIGSAIANSSEVTNSTILDSCSKLTFQTTIQVLKNQYHKNICMSCFRQDTNLREIDADSLDKTWITAY